MRGWERLAWQKTWRSTVATGLAGPLVLLSACGPSPRSAADELAATEVRAKPTTTFRVNAVFQTGQTRTVTGALDLATHRARTINTVGRSTPMIIVVLGRDDYESPLVPLDRRCPAGAKWGKVSSHASTLAPLPSYATEDSRATLHELTHEAESIRRVGRETIRGVSAVHYLLVLAPPSYSTENGSPGFRPAVDLWVDSDGRVRRVVERDPIGDRSHTARIDFYDFGVAVDVSAPPASEVCATSKRSFHPYLLVRSKPARPSGIPVAGTVKYGRRGDATVLFRESQCQLRT